MADCVDASVNAVESTASRALRNRALRQAHFDELPGRDDSMLHPGDLRDPQID
ncbi:MAG TPA: hypothetical protein VFY75_05700 [Solirubrobacterales bacterium]|nr:hypothetical protein [Solirubrobacterales bacterium]